jgi:hypothetical protein
MAERGGLLLNQNNSNAIGGITANLRAEEAPRSRASTTIGGKRRPTASIDAVDARDASSAYAFRSRLRPVLPGYRFG